jgi:hypothetical protein
MVCNGGHRTPGGCGRQLSGAGQHKHTGFILDPEKRSPDKYQAVLRVMRQDVEVDVPHESIEPRGQFGLETLIQRWDDIREKMHALLDSIGPGREGDMVYLHPYGGPLNVTEALAFMEVHFDNHARHMDVILARAE